MSVSPRPITAAEHRRRLRRISRIARHLGFVGRVEYQHVLRETGGAHFGLAASADQDLLSVDARAFERDADPDDFSLEAIIAHERGHQLLHRHPALASFLARWNGHSSEEMMASVIGSLLVRSEKDQQDLLFKAVNEALDCGVAPEDAIWLVAELREKLGACL
jgi:hypothetical protein